MAVIRCNEMATTAKKRIRKYGWSGYNKRSEKMEDRPRSNDLYHTNRWTRESKAFRHELKSALLYGSPDSGADHWPASDGHLPPSHLQRGNRGGSPGVKLLCARRDFQNKKTAIDEGKCYNFLSAIAVFLIHAPCFVQPPQTLLLQLARPRLPCGTRELPLSAAAFLP